MNAGSSADDRSLLRVSTFAGAAALPVHMAAERGYFASAGVDVEVVETTSSTQLMEGLLHGQFQIVHAAPDNVVGWRDRTGADIVAWIGGASGPVALMAAAEITAVADLRGRDIAIDAPQSGFVWVLRKMLRVAGVETDEVGLVRVGATELRLDALRTGRVAATLLTLPWLLHALDDGFIIIAEQSRTVPRLQGSCGASLRPWLDAHPDTADAYLRALIATLTWLYQPGSDAEVRDVLRKRFGISDLHARTVSDAFIDPVIGWPPSAMIDPVGMAVVCGLREESGHPAREPAPAYFTLDTYARVMGSSLLEAWH